MDPKIQHSVAVAVRVRPLIRTETNDGCVNQVLANSFRREVQVRSDSRIYTFDFAFDPSASQRDVFGCCEPVLQNVLKGINGTILCYGQTSSGKTHTAGTDVYCQNLDDESTWGIVPRAASKLFADIANCDKHAVSVTVSFIEIYNDSLLDLLDKKKDLQLRYDGQTVHLPGLVQKEVTTVGEVLHCLRVGAEQRTRGKTEMNDNSSRSHAVFTLYFSIRNVEDESDATTSKLHLVDLAGSERLKKTKAEGAVAVEGININYGLFCLGKVIEHLTDAKLRGKQNFVPYRDHNLTKLLQDSLGGNSCTLFIACLSPADKNVEESLSTLKYAEKASKIKNRPVVNRDPLAAELMLFKRENTELRERLQAYEAGKVFTVAADAAETGCLECPKLQLKIEDMELDLKGKERDREYAMRILNSQTGLFCSTQNKLEKSTETIDSLRKYLETLEENDENVSAKKLLEDINEIMAAFGSESNEAEVDVADAKLDETYDIENHHMIARELEKLTKELSEKEQLMRDSHLQQSVPETHETEIGELEAQIQAISAERDELQRQLNSFKTSGKVAESRRKELQEKTDELNKCRSRLKELQRFQKMYADENARVKKLQDEIKNMREQKVRLLKQMRVESERYRKMQTQKDREINQMLQREKRQVATAVRERDELAQKLRVTSQKLEQANAYTKRLQLQQQNAAVVRNTIQSSEASLTWKNSMKNFVDQQLVSAKDIAMAKKIRSDLFEERRQLNQRKQNLVNDLERLKRQPPKKLHRGENGRTSSGNDEETRQLEAEIQELETRMDECTNKAAELLKQVSNIENGSGENDQRWEKVYSVPQAKFLLSQMFNQLSAAKIELDLAQVDRANNRAKFEEQSQRLSRLEERYEGIERESQLAKETANNTERECRSQILFLLQVNAKLRSGTELSTNEVEKLNNLQDDELAKMGQLQEQLDKERQLRMSAQKMLSRGGTRNGEGFFKSIKTKANADLETSNNLTSNVSVEFKQTRSSRVSKPPIRYGVVSNYDHVLESPQVVERSLIPSEDESDFDYEPEEKELMNKRSGAANLSKENHQNRGCGCRSENKMCDTNRCACKKANGVCSSICSCVEEKCKNRGEFDAAKENLNSTYTKEEADDFAENAIGTSKMFLSYTKGTEDFRKKATTPYRREGKLFGSINLAQPNFDLPPNYQNNKME